MRLVSERNSERRVWSTCSSFLLWTDVILACHVEQEWAYGRVVPSCEEQRPIQAHEGDRLLFAAKRHGGPALRVPGPRPVGSALAKRSHRVALLVAWLVVLPPRKEERRDDGVLLGRLEDPTVERAGWFGVRLRARRGLSSADGRRRVRRRRIRRSVVQ